MDTMVIGGDDDGQVPELDDDEEEGAVAVALSSAEEAALRAAEADVDAAWLRSRGYDAVAANAALAGAAAGAGTLKRRLSALAALQEARGSGDDGDEDAETAAEGRAEERESLEAILGDDVVVYYPEGEGTDWDGDSGLGVPVQGCKSPSQSAVASDCWVCVDRLLAIVVEPLGGAPPLMVEVYFDAVARAGYPSGTAVTTPPIITIRQLPVMHWTSLAEQIARGYSCHCWRSLAVCCLRANCAH